MKDNKTVQQYGRLEDMGGGVTVLSPWLSPAAAAVYVGISKPGVAVLIRGITRRVGRRVVVHVEDLDRVIHARSSEGAG